eukprot:CAMPEP_0113819322 /NCGR_PEP_ID=MMETSP0328-20130328/681_1 /TAXON_ID=39455 /ORGANISM="Alexandrium minutum" /LENGTH=184 /DNA_ID=CAMNT_0000787255 /DNA_START=45 /DNA_END=599 /DNA_ORIENTATION=+ /assembly_acc=CAM_ASM_000350
MGDGAFSKLLSRGGKVIFWAVFISVALGVFVVLLMLLTQALGAVMGVSTLLATAVIGVINVETEAEWEEEMRQRDEECDKEIQDRWQRLPSLMRRRKKAEPEQQLPPDEQLEEDREVMRGLLRGRMQELLAEEGIEDEEGDAQDVPPQVPGDQPARGSTEESELTSRVQAAIRRRHRADQADPD